jgi:hypothetical protein
MLVLVWVLAPLVLVGCEKSSVWDRVPLSGTARLDGAPFSGSICFRPTGGNRGPSTTTKVRDGKFEFDRQTGPVQGAHTVILTPKSDPNNRLAYRIDTKATVTSAEPFTVSLEFTTPELEPEPPTRRNASEEGGTPK